jgi:hypothetical protein
LFVVSCLFVVCGVFLCSLFSHLLPACDLLYRVVIACARLSFVSSRVVSLEAAHVRHPQAPLVLVLLVLELCCPQLLCPAGLRCFACFLFPPTANSTTFLNKYKRKDYRKGKDINAMQKRLLQHVELVEVEDSQSSGDTSSLSANAASGSGAEQRRSVSVGSGDEKDKKEPRRDSVQLVHDTSSEADSDRE